MKNEPMQGSNLQGGVKAFYFFPQTLEGLSKKNK